LLFWLLATSGLALVWPVERVGFDPFAANSVLLWSLIVITMLSLGMLLKPEELLPLRQKPWWVALGVSAQVLVMPALAWAATRLVPMDPELAAGVILVGCVPGAMASNVLTSTAGGNVAYSVSLTTVATLLSPLTVPLVLWLVAGVQTPHSLGRSAVLLSLLVALPTLTGYGLARRWLGVRRFALRLGPQMASIALLWIVASVVAGNRDRLTNVGMFLVAVLLGINVAGYAAGYLVALVAGLPESLRRALTLEIGMQNAGLGTALATSLYGATTAATIPTAAYTFGCMLTGTLLAVLWKRKQPGHAEPPA
jgi:BASS family bile acid:Na+ symporter